MNSAGELSAIILVLLGFAGGWFFTLRRSGTRGVVNVQEKTKKRANEQAAKETKAAKKEHAETVKEAEKAEAAIDDAGLKKLAEMVNKTFH